MGEAAGGAAKLLGFDVRKGKERTGDCILKLRTYGGALVGSRNFADRADISHLEELSRRLLEAEAAGQSADPLAELARNAVTQASYASCCCAVGCSPIRCPSRPASVRSAARPSTSCFWSGGGRHDGRLRRERGCWNADQTCRTRALYPANWKAIALAVKYLNPNSAEYSNPSLNLNMSRLQLLAQALLVFQAYVY